MASKLQLLKRYNQQQATECEERAKLLEVETKKALLGFCDEIDSKTSKSKIPQFYFKRPDDLSETSSSPNAEQNEARSILSDIVRELFLDSKEENLLTEFDLDIIYNNMNTLLKESGDTEYMSYELFRDLKTMLPDRASHFFEPNVYRMFSGNEYGKIKAFDFFQFVSISTNLLHQYIIMSRYDSMGCNYVTESDLEVFINDHIEMMPSLMKIDKQFHPYYVYHAVRKFMFVLDPFKKNKISIATLVTSEVFDEYNRYRFSASNPGNKNGSPVPGQSSMQQPLLGTDSSTSAQSGASGNVANTNESPPTQPNMLKNWFSAQTAMRIYRLYLELDTDRKGTLSRKEMLQYNGSSLSNLCVSRIFQYKRTFDGEMDYKGFLDFVLASENKRIESSLHYFWDIIDLDNKGYITPMDIHTLFRSVKKKMGIFGLEPVNIEDVMSEIIDMIHPVDKLKITKKDLINSKIFGTVVDILTDVKGFWEYDNRESIMQQSDE